MGPGQDSQGCDYGNLQIRVTVIDAGGNVIELVKEKTGRQIRLDSGIGIKPISVFGTERIDRPTVDTPRKKLFSPITD